MGRLTPSSTRHAKLAVLSLYAVVFAVSMCGIALGEDRRVLCEFFSDGT